LPPKCKIFEFSGFFVFKRSAGYCVYAKVCKIDSSLNNNFSALMSGGLLGGGIKIYQWRGYCKLLFTHGPQLALVI
jgi:hypothetical protein